MATIQQSSEGYKPSPTASVNSGFVTTVQYWTSLHLVIVFSSRMDKGSTDSVQFSEVAST